MLQDDQIRELVGKMILERSQLLALLESLSEEEAATPLKPGEWNARQQISHLCQVEATYRAWIQRALEEDGAQLDGVRGERPAIPLEEADRHSAAEHMSEMRRQRETTMSLIAALRPEEFHRRASHASFGTLTVMQWLRWFYRHDRMHYDQLRGVESSYEPRSVGGREQDPGRSASQ